MASDANFRASDAMNALNAMLALSSTRLAGSTRTRKPKIPKPVYPEKYNQKYRLPAGIEEQPF